MPTAVVIDGAFFLRRFTYSFPGLDPGSPTDAALGVSALSDFHIAATLGPVPVLQAIEDRTFLPVESHHLYRIFFYDCAPLTKRVHRPVSQLALHLGSSNEARLRLAIHEQLRSTRKVALRLGRLNERFSGWRPTPDALKRWLSDPGSFAPSDDDFDLDVVQKGVDMRLGLDIASMAFKKQVDQIVLVAADADFVPVAKLARREGIDVLLDTMGGIAAQDLREHVDGTRTCRIAGRPGDRA